MIKLLRTDMYSSNEQYEFPVWRFIKLDDGVQSLYQDNPVSTQVNVNFNRVLIHMIRDSYDNIYYGRLNNNIMFDLFRKDL